MCLSVAPYLKVSLRTDCIFVLLLSNRGRNAAYANPMMINGTVWKIDSNCQGRTGLHDGHDIRFICLCHEIHLCQPRRLVKVASSVGA